MLPFASCYPLLPVHSNSLQTLYRRLHTICQLPVAVSPNVSIICLRAFSVHIPPAVSLPYVFTSSVTTLP